MYGTDRNPKYKRCLSRISYRGSYVYLEKEKPYKTSLTFFKISKSLLPMVISIKSANSYRSDHSPVVLTCKTNEFIKGKSFLEM